MTGAAIVFGKAAGVLRRMMWPFALVAAHFALFTLCGVIRPEAFALVLWVMVTFNAIWIATGIYLSLRLRTVTFAVILNLLLAVIAYAGVAVSLMLGGELLASDSRSSGRSPGRRLLGRAGDVVSALLVYRNRNGKGQPQRMERRQGGGVVPDAESVLASCRLPARLAAPAGNAVLRRVLLPAQVNFPQYIGVVLTVGGLCMMGALALLLWTARRFDRMVGRARQVEPATIRPQHPLLSAGDVTRVTWRG